MKGATTAPWKLPPGDSPKTVWAQFKDSEGMLSEPLSDTIQLDTRPPQGGIRINDDAPSIPEGAPVTLTLLAEDSDSGLSQMMVSNASNFQGSVWENYTTEKSWSLNPGKGKRTVFVRYRDRAGNISKAIQDSIRVE